VPSKQLQAPEPRNLLDAILLMARDPSIDVAKLQALLEMQERLEAHQSIEAFNTAFAAMERKIPRIRKDGVVEHRNKASGAVERSFKFARWEDLDAVIRPVLREHGFSLSFTTEPRQAEGGGLIVSGELLHAGGHSRKASIALALDPSGGKNAIQASGSCFSYGKRYCVTMLLNITAAGEDDDGVSAGVSFVNAVQIARLEELIQTTKADRPTFLRFYGLKKLEDMERNRFPAAEGALLAKLDKAAKSDPPDRRSTSKQERTEDIP
jgi:hypothetical protein